MQRIYLDFAASTHVHPKAARAAYFAMEDFAGNPSAFHEEGRQAAAALFEARKKIAETVAVKPEELLFTSGGTESNNLAIQGVIRALHERGVPYTDMHVVTLSTEHASTLGACELIEKWGVSVTYLKPSFDGLVNPDVLFDALTAETVLVSLAQVNSETGVILSMNDIAQSIKRFRERGISSFKEKVPECAFPVLHVDAAQSPLYLEAGPHTFSADMVSYDSQKVMGPKGVGVLFRDFSVPLSGIVAGGSQERGIRPGTENLPGIVGSAVAFQIAKEERHLRAKYITRLRDYLIEEVKKAVPEAKLIGHPRRRIANNALFAIPGVDGDYLATLMDSEGVAVTPRSACGGSGGGYSHVVLELTGDKELATGTTRFSLGPSIEEGDINEAVRVFRRVWKLARIGP